mmetsp:Transcript_19669/g.29446  ORF Transcript_19669/g.29446 Transcript_19669/m.29446 type:complete len:105 (+) Transcript_19669:32-346(+)
MDGLMDGEEKWLEPLAPPSIALMACNDCKHNSDITRQKLRCPGRGVNTLRGTTSVCLDRTSQLGFHSYTYAQSGCIADSGPVRRLVLSSMKGMMTFSATIPTTQ